MQEAREQAQRLRDRLALRGSDCNVSEAASLLGVSRMTIYRLIEKHGIEAGG